MSALLDALHRHAQADPGALAIDPVVGIRIAYGDLAGLVELEAAELARRHGCGRPVALKLDNGFEAALRELALLEAGVPVLSLPGFFTDAQARHAITECGAEALFTSHTPKGVLGCRTAPIPLPSGTARITFTSGSTGTPKGVCLSRDHLLGVAQSVVDAVGARHAGRHLALLPPGILLETVAGFLATLLAGGTYVCPPQGMVGLADPFRPDFAAMARAVARWDITSLILVPEYLAGLVGVMEESGLRLPLLTIVAVGGARTPRALIARARAVGLPVRQGYGLTECGSVVALEAAGDAVSGSVGRPLPHIRAFLADDGEILLEGPQCLGTIGGGGPAPGPLATGDIGRIDEAGRLWVEGRKSSLIVTSFGRNVSPEWVEEALLAQAGIAQTMVFGDGLPTPEALLVPADADADLHAAVAAANATLPAYARIARWREVAPFTPLNDMLTANGRLRRSVIAATWIDDEPAFFARLEAETFRDRLRFLSIPQVRAGLAGDIDRGAYIAYLEQAWHHVRHTVPLLKAARDRLAHRADLAAALDEYVAEETGHEEWILADIDAAGGDAEAVRHSLPAPATRWMVEHAYDRIAQGNPVSFFGMVYVLESVSVALAQRGAAAVARRLDLPPGAFTYLTSHGALDQDHMRFFAGLVNGLPDPADHAAIITMAREMFGLFGAVFASIELEGARHVVA